MIQICDDSYDRVWKKTFHSGVYEQVVYDALQRLQSVDLKSSGGTVLRAQSYTYDDDSNVLTHTLAGVQTTYGYDEESQLTSESRTGYSASYSYDGNGNRLTRNVGSLAESYAYDAGDKLQSVSWTGHSKTFGYDDTGRTTWEKLDGSFVRQYSYDYESRITSLTYGSNTETYGYNGMNARVSVTAGGSTSTQFRSGPGVIDSLLKSGSTRLTPGISSSDSGNTTYTHCDMKSFDSQTSSAGAVSATKSYDAFGNLDAASGTWATQLGFCGNYNNLEEGSDLKLAGYRSYDPTTGRFIVRDPSKEGRNWYAYCENNPTGRADIDGCKWFFVIKDMEWQNLGEHPIFDTSTGVTVMPCDSTPIPGNLVTIGDKIYLPGDITPEEFLHDPRQRYVNLYNHELAHIIQARQLGPAYLPVYGLEGLWHPFSIFPAYKFSHPMEAQALEREAGAPGLKRIKPPWATEGWGDYPIGRWNGAA